MKNIINSLLLVIFCLIGLVETSIAQDNGSKYSGRYFEARLNKAAYVLQEPVFVEFKAHLLSTDDEPSFLQETSIKVKFEGKIKDFSRIGLITEPPVRLPKDSSLDIDALLQTTQYATYEREISLDRAGEFFSRPGNYQIQFFLHRSDEKLASNIIELKLEEPTGINKKAFDFLNKYKDGFSFEWVYKERDGIKLLGAFVTNYDQSVYGETAIRWLGLYYFFRDELDTAQAEFEKLRLSKNKSTAEDANRYLLDIENRRAYLQRKEQP